MSTTTTATPKVQRVIGEFRGAFCQFARNWWFTLKAFGIDLQIAHVIAEDCSAQLGQAMSRDSKLVAAVSKAKKDGTASFKLSGSSSSVRVSPAMSLVRIVQVLDEQRDKLKAEGYVLPSREFSPDLLAFEPVQDYWKALPAKAASIQWFNTAEELEAVKG